MNSVWLMGLTDTGAENVLAQVWRAVEEQEIASPKLKFVFRSTKTIDINFSFSDPNHGAFILAQLLLCILESPATVTASVPSRKPRVVANWPARSCETALRELPLRLGAGA